MASQRHKKPQLLIPQLLLNSKQFFLFVCLFNIYIYYFQSQTQFLIFLCFSFAEPERLWLLCLFRAKARPSSAYKLRMIPFQIIVSIFIIVFPIPTSAQSKAACNSSCGAGGKTVTVQYPFGFSASCPIRLNCTSNSEIQLKGLSLQVSSITSQSIFLNLLDDCGRSIESIKPLFNHTNYSPTVQNSLLLQNCTPTTTLNSGCVLSPSLFRGQLNPKKCDSRSDNISCFSKQQDREKTPFLSFTDVNATKCKFLFSSMLVNTSALSLQFQTLELGWWLSGFCGTNKMNPNCSMNSICKNVTTGGNRSVIGFRCSCEDGFRGDGYLHGQGCHKAENSESNSPASFFDLHFIQYIIIY